MTTKINRDKRKSNDTKGPQRRTRPGKRRMPSGRGNVAKKD